MSKMQSIRFNYEFSRIYRRGNYIPGKYVVLHYMPNKKGINRIGITTGKKVRGSISRNRMRRLLRETFRLREPYLKKGYDIILLGRENPGDIKQDRIDKDVIYLFKRAGIWDEESDS